MESLPNEVLCKIFQYLRVKDRLRCSLVCRLWADLLTSQQMLKDVQVKLDFPYYKSIYLLVDTRRRYPHLVITNGDMVLFKSSVWSRIGSSINELEFNAYRVPNVFLFTILGACRQLQRLHLRSTVWEPCWHGRQAPPIEPCVDGSFFSLLAWPPKGVDAVAVRRTLAGLKRLTVPKESAMFRAIVEFMPNVVALNLTGAQVRLLTCGGARFRGLQSLKELRQLDLSETECNVETLREITALTKLTVLILANCRNVCNECVAIICDNFTKLEKLDLGGCSKITDKGCFQLAKLHALRELALSEVPLSDRAFEQGVGLSSVTVLILLRNRDITDASLVNIANHHHALELLDLSQCEKITDDGIIALVERLPHLRTLEVHCCPQLTDRSLDAIGDHSRNLKKLGIAECKFSQSALKGFNYRRPKVVHYAKVSTWPAIKRLCFD